MKIAWFTPFWEHSAIGTFSRHVTRRLTKVHDVELWVPEAAGCQVTDLPVVEFDPSHVGPELPSGIDVAVYNLGNNAGYHEAILRVARRMPGVVILHDTVLHHLFLDESRSDQGDLSRYRSALDRWYGPDVGAQALQFIAPDRKHGYPPLDFCARYPLLEEATLGALGVVVHARAQQDRLTPHWLGPMARLSLPTYDAEHVVGPPRQAARASATLRVVSVGWVGQAKQTHVALQALATRPDLAKRILYRIAGPVDLDSEYGKELRGIIETGRLESCVELLGYVEDEHLEELLEWADVFINLRWPSTEGGSAALTEQLIRGRPVIVTRTGVFDELPDTAVIKVAPNDSLAVADALERLANSESERQEVGRAGWQVGHSFTVEAYTRGIVGLIESAPDWELPLTTLDRIGDFLADLHADPALSVFRTVGAELSQIFGPDFLQGRSPAE